MQQLSTVFKSGGKREDKYVTVTWGALRMQTSMRTWEVSLFPGCTELGFLGHILEVASHPPRFNLSVKRFLFYQMVCDLLS